MSVRAIPEGYHSVIPYLIVKGAAQAIDFYCRAFGGREVLRLAGPDGLIGHAEVLIGDSHVMLADENPAWGAAGPQAGQTPPLSVHLYVPNVDAVYAQAVAAGAKVVRPLQDQFYGDRSGYLEDPFGHRWSVASHVEDVTPEEITRRFHALSQQPQPA
jgi:PhnB protein